MCIHNYIGITMIAKWSRIPAGRPVHNINVFLLTRENVLHILHNDNNTRLKKHEPYVAEAFLSRHLHVYISAEKLFGSNSLYNIMYGYYIIYPYICVQYVYVPPEYPRSVFRVMVFFQRARNILYYTLPYCSRSVTHGDLRRQ